MTPPIPMWSKGSNQWAYKLYGPLNIVGSFAYRYCRNAQCGSADDAQTAGQNAHGLVVTPALAPQDIQDTISQWMWPQTAASPTIVATDIPSRGTGFFAAVEYQPYYQPNNLQFNPSALQNVQALGANWVVLTPSWTYSQNNPLLFSSLPGKDDFWSDTVNTVSQASAINLNVALFPQPRFNATADDFWTSAPRDAGWWDNWFNHYRAFAVNYADLATQTGAQALVLGGDWIAPALPAGTLANGTPSGVPADADARWQSVISEVRQHFRGTVMFALPYNNTDIAAPLNVLTSVDAVYLLWFAKLSDSPTPDIANTEFMFPFVSVVRCPQEKMLESIGPTLVCSAITEDAKFQRALTDAIHIDRLNIGPMKTIALNWLQPHEGSIVDFLFRARAFQFEKGFIKI
jgi:hypothetical protein